MILINNIKSDCIQCLSCGSDFFLRVVNIIEDEKVIEFFCDGCSKYVRCELTESFQLCPVCKYENVLIVNTCKHCKGDGFVSDFIEYVFGKEYSEFQFSNNNLREVNNILRKIIKKVDKDKQ